MAWGIPRIGSLVEQNGGNITLTEPAGASQGDLLIACIAYRSNVAFTVPGDWNLVATQQSSGDIDASAGIASGLMMWTIRGASAPTLTFNRTLGNVALGRIIAYSGAQASPYDTGSANTAASSSATVTTGTITTATAGELIVAMTSAGDQYNASAFDAATDPTTASGATDTTTAPTNGTWIERADNSTATGADGGLAIADAIRQNAGATGTIQAGLTNVGRHVMIAAAFKLNTMPTVALNTPAEAGTTTTTPVLDFTGTDAESTSVEYNVQIDTVPSFDSGATFSDNFNDNSIDTAKWNNGSYGIGAISEAGGVAVATCPVAGGTGGGVWATDNTYDLTNKEVKVKVPQVANTATNAKTALSLEIDSINALQIVQRNGTLYFYRLVGGSEIATASVAYNASTHLWWKIREYQGFIYWETSADNITWTTRATLQPPIVITGLRLILYAVTYQAETSPGSANFDDFSYDAFPLLSVFSSTDAGFANPDTGGDLHPFNSGENIQYTAQSALDAGTYYWRVKAQDITGAWGVFTSGRSFVAEASSSAIKTVLGLAKASVKTVNGLVIASVKTWRGLE